MEQYIVSARKYRPASFETVIGQDALTETLRNAIRLNHLAHAYLFCGPRGVGKTTCARIFAKTINCLNPSPNHDACNECESCRAFNEQRSFNIHELDAASNNSVEDIRALIQEVRIPPQIGKYSVYIIDEVHMLSQGAFNALLKTLEEPPSYAIFILATTEKHKVLPTILSRCQVFDFQRITVRDTINHLAYVAKQEGITADEQALAVIAEKADGGMRDALSIFDQLVAFCGNTVTYQRTIEVLNVLDSAYYFRFVDAALQHDAKAVLLMFNEILQKGFDAGCFVVGLMQHIRNVLMAKDQVTLSLLETSDAIRTQYATQSTQCPAVWLFQALDVLNTCDVQYRTARNKRLTVEIALIKLTQLGLAQSVPTPAMQPVAANSSSSSTTAVPASVASSAPQRPIAQSAPPAPAAQVEPSGFTRPAAPKPSAPSVNTISAMPRLHTAVQYEQKSAGASPMSTFQNEEHNNPFGLDQLLDVWAGLPKLFFDKTRLTSILNEYKPVLLSDTEAELVLTNPWQEELFDTEVMQTINTYARQHLKNDRFILHLRIATYQKDNQVYTDAEKYKVLMQKNPALAELTSTLNMQLL